MLAFYMDQQVRGRITNELRRRGIDFDEPRMRQRTTEYARVRHPRQLNIGRVDRLAGDLFDAVDSGRIGPCDRIVVLLVHG